MGKHTAYDPFSEYLMLCILMYISYAFMGSKSFINGLFSDQKGGNKLLSVAKISARQLSGARCCYQMTRGRCTLHQASVSVRMPRGEHRSPFLVYKNSQKVYISGDMSAL